MSGAMQWVRDHYDVPAHRGRRVTFKGEPGRITSASGGHLRVRLDTGQRIITHPKWEMDYNPAVDEASR